MSKRLIIFTGLLIAAVVLLPASVKAQGARLVGADQVEPIPCPIDIPDSVTVECNVLQVPENYAEPDGPQLRLPFIVLRSPYPGQARDPLLYTAGGPGWSSLDSIWGFVGSPMLYDRDVIVFEQRGNRYADPSLVCADIRAEGRDGKSPCLDAIREQGIDITQYTTGNIVSDIISLRQALGYEQWNLYGTSYSTSLMLLVMEADPEGVRSVVLHSVKPPHETGFAHPADIALRAIEQLFADCSADSQCAQAYPDLQSDFYSLVKELNKAPVPLEIRDSADAKQIELEMSGDMLIDWIMLDSFYQPAYPPFKTAYLPLLITELKDGNLAPLKGAVQSFWNETVRNSHWAWGLMLAINCQEEMPAAKEGLTGVNALAIEMLDGFDKMAAQKVICNAWNLPPVQPAGNAHIRGDIPALVLAGSYDPVTPPAWSKATADHLSNSTFVEFSGQGHNVTIENPCAEELQTAFLKDPLAPLDTSCVGRSKGPRFVLPGEVLITPGLSESVYDIDLGSSRGTPWIETISIISLSVLVVMFLALLVIGLVWLLRRERRPQSGKSALTAGSLALLVIIALLIIPFLVTEINNEYIDINMILYSLGPSSDFGPAILLAWLMPVAGLFILILAAITLDAWLNRRWMPAFRVVLGLVVLASLPVLMLGLRWGLFTMLF